MEYRIVREPKKLVVPPWEEDNRVLDILLSDTATYDTTPAEALMGIVRYMPSLASFTVTIKQPTRYGDVGIS